MRASASAAVARTARPPHPRHQRGDLRLEHPVQARHVERVAEHPDDPIPVVPRHGRDALARVEQKLEDLQHLPLAHPLVHALHRVRRDPHLEVIERVPGVRLVPTAPVPLAVVDHHRDAIDLALFVARPDRHQHEVACVRVVGDPPEKLHRGLLRALLHEGRAHIGVGVGQSVARRRGACCCQTALNVREAEDPLDLALLVVPVLEERRLDATDRDILQHVLRVEPLNAHRPPYLDIAASTPTCA